MDFLKNFFFIFFHHESLGCGRSVKKTKHFVENHHPETLTTIGNRRVLLHRVVIAKRDAALMHSR